MSPISRLAAVLLLATAASAHAGDAGPLGPTVVGTGENASVEYAGAPTNILGGALTRVVGSGEGASVEVLSVQQTQSARSVTVIEAGENKDIVATTPRVTRRLASLFGGR